MAREMKSVNIYIEEQDIQRLNAWIVAHKPEFCKASGKPDRTAFIASIIAEKTGIDIQEVKKGWGGSGRNQRNPGKQRKAE